MTIKEQTDAFNALSVVERKEHLKSMSNFVEKCIEFFRFTIYNDFRKYFPSKRLDIKTKRLGLREQVKLMQKEI